MKIFLLILVVLMLSSSYNSAISNKTRAQIESLNKVATIGDGFVNLANKKDVQSAIDFCSTLASTIPNVGVIAIIISSILKFVQGGEEDQVMKRFDDVNRKLDVIAYKIDQLESKTEEVAIISSYKVKKSIITKLKDEYSRFTKNPTKITEKELKRKCKDSNMLDVARWFKTELADETDLPLRQVVLGDYNLERYAQWVIKIVGSVSEASFLHMACIGIVHKGDEREVNKTLNGVNGDIKLFERITNELKDVIRKLESEIKANFFEKKGVSMIKHFMEKHPDMSNEKFVTELLNFLTRQFSWRSWSVTSYDGKTSGWDQHCLHDIKNTKVWIRTDNRCLFVGSTNRGIDASAKLKACTEATDQKSLSAKTIFDELAKCLGGYNGLAVVQFGNGLWQHGNTHNTGFVNFKHYDRCHRQNSFGCVGVSKSFSAIFIPPDL